LSTPAYNAYRINFIDRYTGFITGVYGDSTFLMTINGGLTWDRKSLPGNRYVPVNIIKSYNNKLYAGTGGEYIGFELGHFYTSEDGGNTWAGITTWGCSFLDIEFLDANTGIAGTGLTFSSGSNGGIFRTTNGGMNWTMMFGDFLKYEYVDFSNASTGFAMGNSASDFGYDYRKVIKTTNGGLNWFDIKRDSVLTLGPKYQKMQFINSNTGYLLYINLIKTTDGGQSWFEPYIFPPGSAKSFHFINSETGWISGALSGKIYKTTDGGYNWAAQTIPVTNVSGETFFLDETHGWTRATGSIVLTTDTTGLMGISIAGSEVPESFSLHQNYPNPFNPETKIKFEIPLSGRGQKSEVRLSVYDISGKEIGTLVNNELAPGVYEYSFDGAGLGSGVYFYKLQSGDFVETRRMVLVK